MSLESISDEYKREVDNIETKYKTKEQLLIKTDQEQANKRYYYLITAISHYPFLLFSFKIQN
jgi:hypothetical protein